MGNESRHCPYNTLEISQNATNEEVKAAFRRLSLETHPDTAGVGTCGERFKRIAHAASILTNSKSRHVYDQSMMEASHSSFNHFRRSPLHNNIVTPQNPHGMTAILDNMFRPRNLVMGPIAFIAVVSAIQYGLGIGSEKDNQSDSNGLVQVWKNPSTGQYETPAPWDPLYQRTRPDLEYVPKDQVRLRRQ